MSKSEELPGSREVGTFTRRDLMRTVGFSASGLPTARAATPGAGYARAGAQPLPARAHSAPPHAYLATEKAEAAQYRSSESS